MSDHPELPIAAAVEPPVHEQEPIARPNRVWPAPVVKLLILLSLQPEREALERLNNSAAAGGGATGGIVVGGGADMPNFRERVELEVEQSARTAAATKALAQAIEEEGDGAVPLEAAVLRTRFRAAEAVFQGGCMLSASASALARSTVSSSGDKPAPEWLSKAATGSEYTERCREATQAGRVAD